MRDARGARLDGRRSTCSATRWARCPRTSYFYPDGDRAGRGAVRVPATPAGTRHGRGARRRAGRTERLRRPARGARPRPGRPVAAARVLVPAPRSTTSTATARPSSSPTRTAGGSSTFVERDGQPIAVLLHDPVLEHNAELVQLGVRGREPHARERAPPGRAARAAGRAAGIARAAGAGDRRRAATDRARPPRRHPAAARLDRDVARTARVKAPGRGDGGPTARARDPRGARRSPSQELRELTHGINPPLLAERGLAAALDELCRRAALPDASATDDRSAPPRPGRDRRLLHGQRGADQRRQALPRQRGPSARRLHRVRRLTVEVGDDGIGGAAPTGGSGAARARRPRRGARRPASRSPARRAEARPCAPRSHARSPGRRRGHPARRSRPPARRRPASRSSGSPPTATSCSSWSSARGPTSRSSTSGCRRRTPTRDCARPRPSASDGPRSGILVLSQHVNTRYALELLSTGTDGVGYLLKERVSDLDELAVERQPGRPRRLGARPGGRRRARRPPPARRQPAGAASPTASARCSR